MAIGDLMLPRFSGERRIDADDWVQDLLDYVAIRHTTDRLDTLAAYPINRRGPHVATRRAARDHI